MIIGFVGIAGSGKDVAANILVDKYRFLKIAVADPVKRIAQNIFDFNNNQLWGPSFNRNIPDKRYPRDHVWNDESCLCCSATDKSSQCYLTPRYALQMLGTAYGRHCYNDIWVDKLLSTIEVIKTNIGLNYTQDLGIFEDRFHEPIVKFIIPDLRFKNEIAAVKKSFGKIIRIKRPGAGLKGAASRHTSEIEQNIIPESDFDFTIINDGGLDKLNKQIETIYNKL